jgi:hypothetical protein
MTLQLMDEMLNSFGSDAIDLFLLTLIPLPLLICY